MKSISRHLQICIQRYDNNVWSDLCKCIKCHLQYRIYEAYRKSSINHLLIKDRVTSRI
jgi:hypothetical protein